MGKRKQTPDVLAEILGGALAAEAGEGNGGIGLGRRNLSHSQEDQPQSWEYALVTFQDYKGWRPRFLNGQDLEDWTAGPLIHEFLAEMGEGGWELVAASAGERLYGNNDNHQLYFKRQA
jgi:hypothetical protein